MYLIYDTVYERGRFHIFSVIERMKIERNVLELILIVCYRNCEIII